MEHNIWIRLGPYIWVVPKVLWVTDYITAPNIQGYQNGTLIVGITHMGMIIDWGEDIMEVHGQTLPRR